MKQKFFITLILLLCLSCVASESWAARRLGGGSNIGRQSNPATLQRAPLPPPAAPSAAPAPRAMPAAPAVNPGVAAAPARRSWLGPLAGFAGGALLGGLLFGNGGGFGGMGGIGSLLLPLLLIGAVVFFVRRFLASAQPNALMRTAGNGPDVAPGPAYVPPEPAGNFGGQPNRLGGPTTTGVQQPDISLPAGFDLPAFLREAKLAFIRLQAANDRADLHDLRSFTTPQMFAELDMQIRERGSVVQQVDVLALDAVLLDLRVEAEEAIATVQYLGTVRENQGVAEPVNELWTVTKRIREAGASWLLAGVQQVA